MKKYILKSLFVLSLVFLGGSSAYANITYSQIDSSTLMTTYNTGQRSFIQTLGTSLSGYFDSFEYYVIADSNTQSNMETWLHECPTSLLDLAGGTPTSTTCSSYLADSDQITSSPHDVKQLLLSDFSSSNYYYYADPSASPVLGTTAIILDSSKYYFVSVIDSGGEESKLYGSTSNNYANGSCTISSDAFQSPPYTACTQSVLDLYFRISDGGIVAEDIPYASGINISSPSYNQIFDSPYSVNFSGSYSYVNGLNNMGVYDTLRFELVNNNTITSYDLTSHDIALTGSPQEGTFSFTEIMSADSVYSFKAYFFDSTDLSVPFYYSPNLTFSTGTGGGLTPSGTPQYTCNNSALFGDMICFLKNFATWLFLPSQTTLARFGTLTLENSFPFSYIYDMGVLYDDAFNQSASSFDITIPFGSGTITLLSTAKLNAVPFQGLVRTILGAIVLFFTAMFIYRKIIKVHDSSNTQTI